MFSIDGVVQPLMELGGCMWETIENGQVLLSSIDGVKGELTPYYLLDLYVILYIATTWECHEFRYPKLFKFYITI